MKILSDFPYFYFFSQLLKIMENTISVTDEKDQSKLLCHQFLPGNSMASLSQEVKLSILL